MSTRNSAVIESTSVDQILTSGFTAAKASPVAHIGSPCTSPRTSTDGHQRIISSDLKPAFDAPELRTEQKARPNRFSVSFAKQPLWPTSSSRPQSPTRSTPLVYSHEVAPAVTGPTDTNFLTAIASHERRVLELREELAKAEAELGKLKDQWAQHEAHKKRNDARSVAKLQPLQTMLPSQDKEDDADGSSAWMQAEMERRKALLNQNRTAGRTVFAGSKHTRALSLLSPTAGPSKPSDATPRPPRTDSLSEPVPRTTKPVRHQPRIVPITRASTTPDLSQNAEESSSSDNPVDPEVLLKTGKKMATDLRDGLWMFWEDLRQATVGEDGAMEHTRVSPPSRGLFRHQRNLDQRNAKKTAARSSLRSSAASTAANRTQRPHETQTPSKTTSTFSSMSVATAPALADPSFWAEHVVSPFAKTSARSHEISQAASTPIEDASSDAAWDTWDDASITAPSPKNSPSSSVASETNTLPTTASEGASPRLSTDLFGRRTSQDVKASTRPIPWPALKSIGPQALRKTASHLMSEWEMSVSPDQSQEFTGDGEFLGRPPEATTATDGVENGG